MFQLWKVGSPIMSNNIGRPALLDRKELKGSRLSCLWLTSGSQAQAASRLNTLAGGQAHVSRGSFIMPRGPLLPEEPQLGRSHGFLSEDRGGLIRNFWLANCSPSARLPTWDVAATCLIKGKQGLILVEAKAHTQELDDSGKRLDATTNLDNHSSIGAAIDAANADLNRRTPNWNLNRDHHYQVSNRFTWAWKLAELGVPVVLVFLGILEAEEMDNATRRAFASHDDWKTAMLNHTAGVIPRDAWGQELQIGAASFIPLIRSARSNFHFDG